MSLCESNVTVFQAFPGMMQYKRAGGDKSGMPVFQQNSGAYQQLLQPFVPTVSCECYFEIFVLTVETYSFYGPYLGSITLLD